MGQRDDLLDMLREALLRAAMNSPEVCAIVAELSNAGAQRKVDVSFEPDEPFDVARFDSEFLRSMRITP
jgi:hypothetical protein